jgi:hypothetical protein
MFDAAFAATTVAYPESLFNNCSPVSAQDKPFHFHPLKTLFPKQSAV